MFLSTRPPLRRIVAIDAAIRRGEHPTAASLARTLEAGRRTIQRDIAFMRDSLGAPLEFRRDCNGYHYRDPSWQLPFLQLTEGELVAVFVGEQALRQYRGTPFHADLARAFAKITGALGDTITIDPARLEESHSFRTSAPATADARMFGRLAAAVLHRRQLRLTYWTASRDSVNERIVDPCHLVSIDGEWFLVAFCHLREKMRMFTPARIRRLAETGRTFTPPPDFSIAAYLDGAFRVVRDPSGRHTVRLRFAADAAKYVRERTWHPTQQIRELPGGGLELTLTVESLIEVRRWALSFGPDCEALAPPELREQLRDDAARMHAAYTAEPSVPAKRLAPSRRRPRPKRTRGAG